MRTWAVRTVLVVGFGLIVKETLWQTERKAGTLPAPPAVQQLRPFHKTKANKGSNPPQRTKHYSTQVKFHPLPPHARVMTLDDMPDLANATHILNILDNEDVQNMTWDQAIVGREPIVEALHQAGVQFDLNVLKILPYWSDVQELYGTEPVILGLDQCQAFRRAHPVEQRFVGIAGQHNCGTNAMSKYMMENLIIPENHGVGNGILANVPWHKHGWVDLRSNYMFSAPPEHENVLPVLLVRDPYYWMGSMCESPYLMKWMHSKDHCPNLVRSLEEDEGVPAKTMWGRNERKWDSLAHVWSEFNGEYVDADFPRLVIRFEDVLFHLPKVLEAIRGCVDAKWKNEFFAFFPSAVKQKKYFTDIKPQSSMLSAIIKYGQDHGRRQERLTEADIIYARKHLDAKLMKTLHYQHPKSDRG